MWWLTFLGIVAAMFVLDVTFALYTRRVAQGAALSSAIFASTICLLGATVVVGYMEDKLYIFAAMIGAFLGTYITVRWDHKRKQT